ncbi:MAG: hypothetical protein U0Y82_03225 [Thermoleophilia bacterium]
MLRKRYLVVVVGRGGLAEAHRSEISRHRSEREALAAAEEEREHLGVMHGERAGNYRVVVERDGVSLEDEPARVLTRAADPFPPAPEPVAEHVRVLRRRPAPEPDAEAAEPPEEHHDTQEIPLQPPAPEAATDPPDGPSEHPAPPRPDRGRQPRPRMPALDDIPSGPVPDDVLRRFEEANPREDRRNARTPIEERTRTDGEPGGA